MKKTAGIVFFGLPAALLLFLLPTFYIGGPPNRTIDLNNLRQVGMACNIFAKERNTYPIHLGELFDPELGLFTEPEEAKSIFLRHQSPTEAGTISDIMEWTDWVYLPGHSDNSPPESLILFLPPGYHYIDKEPVALVVSVDGTPKILGLAEFVRKLNTTLRIIRVSEKNAEKPDEDNGVEVPGPINHP